LIYRNQIRFSLCVLRSSLWLLDQECQPQVHRIWGYFDGYSIAYDRIVLPLPAPAGGMMHLFSITDELGRARMDDLARPGLIPHQIPQDRWLTLVK